MNGKMKALHFVTAVSSSSCCFTSRSLIFFYTSIYPSATPLYLYVNPLPSSLCIPLAFMSLLPCCQPMPPSILSIFQSLHLSQYFDEEQDDHEYPYYYEETTGIPSSSAPPSPQPGAPNQQVKREQE